VSPNFEQAQQELNDLLSKHCIGELQTGELEQNAQKLVNEYFKKRAARKNHVLIESCGMRITGCELAFTLGGIRLSKWLTSYHPQDRFAVVELNKGAVPMGYANGHQLYVLPRKDKPGHLVVRYGMGPAHATWCPALQGMPATNSLFFVTLERAKALGYLPLLEKRH
jgi:hypothetical protein